MAFETSAFLKPFDHRTNRVRWWLGWLLWFLTLAPVTVLLLPGAEPVVRDAVPGLLVTMAGLAALLGAIPFLLRHGVYGTRSYMMIGLALAWSGTVDVTNGVVALVGVRAEAGMIAGRLWLAIPLLLLPIVGSGLRTAHRPVRESLVVLVIGLIGIAVLQTPVVRSILPYGIYPHLPIHRPAALVAVIMVGLGLSSVVFMYRGLGSRVYWWLALALAGQGAAVLIESASLEPAGLLGVTARLVLALTVVEILVGQSIAQIDLLRDRQVAVSDLKRSLAERETNLSRMRRYAEDLERSQEDIESYTYAASHDLQEPLRSVQFFSAMLKEKYADRLDDKGREYLDYAVDGAERMGHLIAAILDYSRVQRQGLHFRRINVRDCVDLALTNLEQAIERSGAELSCDDLPEVTVDRTHLTRLLQNLIGNAIKYNISDRPRVLVSATRAQRSWIISVVDNGIGIDPKYHERIFGVFKRLHKRDEFPGTGVGLSICQRIVERRGGRIWVESLAGSGAEFKFSIPDEIPASEWESAQDESDA